MKLTIETSVGTLLKIEEHELRLPEGERDLAECMIMLSEALVLLAGTCEAENIEDAASEMSDSIRRGIDSQLRAVMPDVGVHH